MPAFVRPDQSDDAADTTAPRRADARRAPIGAVVWAASPAWIVESSIGNRSSDRGADSALYHARSTRYATTDVETTNSSAWDRE